MAADTALRDSANQAESELSQEISELLSKLKVEVEAIMLEAERANAVHIHRSQQEQVERQAAITEVYRRLQIAREMDTLLTRVAEAAMLEQIQRVQIEVERSGETAELAVHEKLRELVGRIDVLQQEDETLKLKVDDLVSTTNKSEEEVREGEELLGKQIKMIASQMQERLEENAVRFKAEIMSVGELVDSTAQTLHSAVTVEREERVKADADLSAEWNKALNTEKEERGAALNTERGEWTAAAVREKEDRIALIEALRQAPHTACIPTCPHTCTCTHMHTPLAHTCARSHARSCTCMQLVTSGVKRVRHLSLALTSKKRRRISTTKAKRWAGQSARKPPRAWQQTLLCETAQTKLRVQ
jgi:hypothetical protein